jgi:hypothetical protein
MAESNGAHQTDAKRQYVGDVTDVRRAAEAIQERKAVREDSGAEGAEENVLKGGFVGTLLAAEETGEDVEAEGHGFEAEEEDDQIGTRCHEHHADAGE